MMRVAWNYTDAELAAIYGEMAAIHETPAKMHTPLQLQRLKQLRREAVEIGMKRYSLINDKGVKNDCLSNSGAIKMASMALRRLDRDEIAFELERATVPSHDLYGLIRGTGYVTKDQAAEISEIIMQR